MKKHLYYIYDPMCSWCYAFAPTFETIKKNLDNDYEIIYIPGGLAPHTNEVMPQAMQDKIQNTWKEITKVVGTSFNHNFWTQCIPKRSTYLACQATIAARLQNKEEEMIKGIQEAYYKKAQNPSELDTLINIANNLDLEVEQFKEDITSPKVIELFQTELNMRRKLNVHSFPTLLLQYKKEYYPINILYNQADKMLTQIKNLSENIYF